MRDLQRVTFWAALLVATTSALPVLAEDGGYVQHNLVSDLPGMADKTDPNLVNAWGIDRSATSPWWVNGNGTGVSILYNGSGTPFPVASPLVVTVPPPAGGAGPSTPTGVVFNGTTDFQLATGAPARFLFATEDGTISGWNPAVNPTNAVIEVDNSPMAVYKGIAPGVMGGKNVLYAANFRGGTVDVFDGSFAPVALAAGMFQDERIPEGYAPFNVANIGGSIFVTYAKQDPTKHDDVAGPGRGFLDEYTPDGTLVMRFRHGPWMNSPWGVEMAPAGFGKLSGRLLLGNFGSGQIASFDPSSGEFEGMLHGRHERPITIDGLWGIKFGNGANAGPANVLFFSAGIQDEAHGLFGTLTFVPGKDHGK